MAAPSLVALQSASFAFEQSAAPTESSALSVSTAQATQGAPESLCFPPLPPLMAVCDEPEGEASYAMLRLHQGRVSEIIAGRLSLSGIEPVYSHEAMAPFTHVLSAVEEDFATPALSGKQRAVFLVRDSSRTLLPLEQAVAWIVAALNDSSKNNVLVHCHAGMSRSAAIVCAFLVDAYGLSVDAAMRRLRAARPIVDPNPGFRLQVRSWEATCAAKRMLAQCAAD